MTPDINRMKNNYGMLNEREMLGESTLYYVRVPNEEYEYEFHSATEAKRFMKQHPGSTGEKVRIRSNGEWEPCGEIVLNGRNSVRMSDRKSYTYESRRPHGRMITESMDKEITEERVFLNSVSDLTYKMSSTAQGRKDLFECLEDCDLKKREIQSLIRDGLKYTGELETLRGLQNDLDWYKDDSVYKDYFDIEETIYFVVSGLLARNQIDFAKEIAERLKWLSENPERYLWY